MNKHREVPTPLSTNEMYLHGINVRLEVLIDQVSSLLSHIAEKNGVTMEETKVEQARPTRTRKA